MKPSDIVAHWRTEASVLRSRYADERGAALFELHAQELEEAIAKGAEEILNLEEAASESGYSSRHLGRLVADGRIPNAGRKHAPGIRRRDLPARPGRAAPEVAHGRPDIPSIGAIGRKAMRSRERRGG